MKVHLQMTLKIKDHQVVASTSIEVIQAYLYFWDTRYSKGETYFRYFEMLIKDIILNR